MCAVSFMYVCMTHCHIVTPYNANQSINNLLLEILYHIFRTTYNNFFNPYTVLKQKRKETLTSPLHVYTIYIYLHFFLL